MSSAEQNAYRLCEPRRFGAVNWIGLRTLYKKEIARFLSVSIQTIAAPVVTGLLFLAVLHLSIGDRIAQIKGLDFVVFLMPGIIVMSMMQNAFANCSSSIMVGKIQGHIVDVLLPPVNNKELMVALLGGGVTRGLMVGSAIWLAALFFIPFGVHNLAWIIVQGVLGCAFLSLLGILGGLWAQRFDHISVISNFIITPLTFLSGTFYSIERLPELAYKLALFNPLFYVIDGVRYGFTGVSDGSVWTGFFLLATLDVLLFVALLFILRSGWRLRA